MSKKNLICLTTKDKDGDSVKYEGRFLGFIKDDEFNALCQNTADVANKLESKATQDLLEVAGKFDNMAGFRLVMTVRKVGKASVIKKTLFITEGLDMITEVKPRCGDVPGQVKVQAGGNKDIVIQEIE